MYQIWYRGRRIQQTYDTWEEACEGRDEKIRQLIMEDPEEEKNLLQYMGNKEGMKRKRASSVEPKKTKESSDNKKKVAANEMTSKKIVVSQSSTKSEKIEQKKESRVEQPAAPISKEAISSFNVVLPTLKHNLPPLNKKEVKEALSPVVVKEVKVSPPVAVKEVKDVKEVLPPLITKEVDSGVESIKTHLPVLLPDGLRTEIEIKVIDIHKLRAPGKENCEIHITVRAGDAPIPVLLKVFQFHQLYKLIAV